MLYDKILIDVANFYHSSYSTAENMKYTLPSGEVVLTGGIYNFLRSLKKLERTQLQVGGSIFFLFDNASSINGRRKQIDPDYKSNRFRKDPLFYRGLDFLHLILLSYDNKHFTVRSDGAEADDLVDVLCRSFRPDDKVLLASNDHDWARGIAENIHWYVRGKESTVTIYTRELYRETFGFLPSRESVCMYKSFHGDDVDKIPNAVPDIRKDILIRICSEFKSLKDLFFQLETSKVEYISEIWKTKILSAKGRLLLNWSLVDYQAISELQLGEDLTPTRYEPKNLRTLYTSLGFNIEKLDPRPELLIDTTDKTKPFFQFEKMRRT